jgi:hypothetical protein
LSIWIPVLVSIARERHTPILVNITREQDTLSPRRAPASKPLRPPPLYRALIPQLYFPVAFLLGTLDRYTGVFVSLGLAADSGKGPRHRIGPRPYPPGGLAPPGPPEEDEDLTAEVLMPPPISRYARVSTAFLIRHGLLRGEGEGEEGLVMRSPGAHPGDDEGEEEEGRGRRGPMFRIGWTSSGAGEGGVEVGVDFPTRGTGAGRNPTTPLGSSR